jgi:hypothetical protein
MGGWIISYNTEYNAPMIKLITEHPALFFSKTKVSLISCVIRVEPDDFAQVEINFRNYINTEYNY